MADNLITFQDALKKSSTHTKRHLLAGNGFSIACRREIFTYESLFSKADFSSLNNDIKSVFKSLNTNDFELVMQRLKHACEILEIYAPHEKILISKIKADSDTLKNVLINAIASSHPAMPSEIEENEYANCRKFLDNFNNVYTLNYDLLIYWTYMHDQTESALISDDGFRTPDGGKEEYVSWDIEKTKEQDLFYLHGALHLFDAGAQLRKYTWINTGVRLIDQIRHALDTDLFPVFVSEGSSTEKLNKITHSNYLSRGFRSFSSIGGALFIYGHSLAINDSHILNLIPKSKVKQLFVSIYGNIMESENQAIVKTAQSLVAQRNRRDLELYFYDSSTANVWR